MTLAPVVIVGPTAVGKSVIAETVAATLGGEIVSADSMQVYRGMDIGTAKAPVRERRVAYHCVDLVDPDQPYSAALFQRDARSAIDDILLRGLLPVVVGGTGLYVRAALDTFEFPEGQVASATRVEIESHAEAVGAGALHAELAALDPAAARRIHPNNVRRTVRALEMLATGRRYAEQAEGFTTRTSHYPGTRFVGVTMDRGALYTRIDARVDAMLAAGLLDEVRRIVSSGYADALTAIQAIGYKELLEYLDGLVSLEESVETIKRSSRRYAKRQMTWFRADPRITWVDVTGLSADDAADSVLRLLESSELTS